MPLLPQSGSDAGPPVDPLRVLLAEDHVLSQTMTVRLLQAEGHEVHVVANGVDAVAACRMHRFDFVLMDLRLPGIDGLEAIRIIRTESPDVPERTMQIWALTAESGPETVAQCIGAGADGHLAKPLKPQQLSLLLGGKQEGELKGTSSATSHRETLLNSVGHDQTLALSLVNLFLSDFDSLFQRIQASISCCDFSTLLKEAHSLKSPARIFGAKKLHALCDRVEGISRIAEREQLNAVGDEFLGELQSLRQVVGLLRFDEDDHTAEKHSE